jgi:hypothetical protein
VPVVELYFFMNPVEKLPLSPPGDPEPIMDPALHYRWHTVLVPGSGTFDVKVTNQFGDQIPWEIDTWPLALLAPASKAFSPNDPGPPPPGQHYACYAARNAPSAGAFVDLNDQFGNHGPAEVTIPNFLCVPVTKTKDQQVYPIFEAADGRDHLACYDIPLHPHTEVVNTRTQFTGIDPDAVETTDDRYLCVPSTKTYDAVPSPARWSIATLGLLMLLMVLWVAQRRVRHGAAA